MSQVKLADVGYRWTRPAWERAADRSWLLIVPSPEAADDADRADSDPCAASDPRFDRSQRLYQVYEFDGSWLDELHEVQVERLLKNPQWRHERSRQLGRAA